MRKITLILVFASFVISCNNGPKEIEGIDSVEKTSATDSKFTPTDSLFVDFFENFMWDKEFQKSRVVFPFKQNSRNILASDNWKHISFYTQSSHIPILNSDTLSLFDKDIKALDIKMSIIDFERSSLDRYGFKKIDNKWFLTGFANSPIKDVPDLEFINFINEFSRDSVFQISHMSFPLLEAFADADNNYETTTRAIKREDWRFRKMTEDINKLLILSDIDLESRYRNIFFRGVENGIWMRYTFEKINGDWKLIKIEDYST